MQAEDKRTLADLAREALQVQDACNLSGVVHSFSRAISRLRALLPEAGTAAINQHPIVMLWADKVSQLAGTQGGSTDWAMEAYERVQRIADGREMT